jgi:hypothetical protein
MRNYGQVDVVIGASLETFDLATAPSLLSWRAYDKDLAANCVPLQRLCRRDACRDRSDGYEVMTARVPKVRKCIFTSL